MGRHKLTLLSLALGLAVGACVPGAKDTPSPFPAVSPDIPAMSPVPTPLPIEPTLDAEDLANRSEDLDAHRRLKELLAAIPTPSPTVIPTPAVTVTVGLAPIATEAAPERGYVNRCVNDIRRRPSQPLSQRRSHPRIERRDRRLRSTQGPSDG